MSELQTIFYSIFKFDKEKHAFYAPKGIEGAMTVGSFLDMLNSLEMENKFFKENLENWEQIMYPTEPLQSHTENEPDTERKQGREGKDRLFS